MSRDAKVIPIRPAVDDSESWEFENGIDDEEDEFAAFDCAMDRHGNCGKAGSEECDWECPYNRVRGLRN